MNAEQMKGKVPLRLPHCGLESVKISVRLHSFESPLHHCTDIPRKIIFLG